MKYLIYEIESHMSYMFTIGYRRENPDSKFKKKVKSDIDMAMNSFERIKSEEEPLHTAAHNVAVVYDPGGIETGENDLSLDRLMRHRQYLIFALFYSRDSVETLKESELEEQKEEISKALETTLGDNSEYPIKIAIVTLNDCSVQIIPIDRPIEGKMFW